MVRVIFFGLGFSLAPLGVLPFSVRIAISLVLLFVSAPSEQVLPFLAQGNGDLSGAIAGILPSWSVALSEAAIGLTFALCASVGVYAAQVFGTWMSKLIAGSFYDTDEVVRCREENWSNPLVGASILLFLVVFFQPALIEPLSTFTTALLSVPDTGPNPSLIATQLIPTCAKVVFLSALLLVLPLLTASIFTDLILLLVARFLRPVPDKSLTSAIKIPILLFAFWISLYPIKYRMRELGHASLSKETIESAGEALR